MERRVLIAIFLSFIVLYAYQALVGKPTPRNAAPVAPSAPVSTQPPSPAGVPATSPPSPALASPAGTLVGDTAERESQVDSRDVIAVGNNREGRLKSWR